MGAIPVHEPGNRLVSEDPTADSEADPCLKATLLTEQGTEGSSIH